MNLITKRIGDKMKTYGDLYKSEILGFKKLGEKFLEGQLSVPDFKSKSGGMGVYAQRGKEGFMIRLRTPCGLISFEHLKLIQKYMKKYKIESVHFTSRQAVQLHDLSLDEVCEIMMDAIDYDLFTRGGGGNYPRNVALSPMSGVEKGEAFDVTDFALQVSEYFIANASQFHLPRKLKVAFSNSCKDTACATINDIGFVAVIENGEPKFRVFLAGGMGNNPQVAIPYDKLIDPYEAIYYVEAYLRTFIELGNYKNRAKARSRFIPKEVGLEKFIECFERHVRRVKKTESFEKIEATIVGEEEWIPEISDTLNLKAQKQKDLYTVILHPRFGKLSMKMYDYICNYMENALLHCNPECKIELRLSMQEELYVRNLTKEQANEFLEATKSENQFTNVMHSISCVGVPTCQIGVQNSRALLLSILEAIENNNLDGNLLPKIHISGCLNSCARHQIAELGFAGKKVSIHGQLFDVYELYAGGNVSLMDTHMGKLYGTITVDNIPGFILELGQMLEREEMCFHKFLNTNEEAFCDMLSKFLVVKE